MKYKIVTIILISVFSSLLWVFVSFSSDYSTTLKIPLHFTNIPEGYAIKYVSSNEVSMSINGEGWQLAQITFGKDHSLEIPLSMDEKEQNISVRAAVDKNSWIQSSVQITVIDPEVVSYSLERMNYRTVKIILKADLNYKPGYGLVSNIKLNPDTVTISGPKSIIQSIDSVDTENLLVENLDTQSSVEINLTQIPNVNFGIKSTLIEFEVQKIVDKEFENIFVQRTGVPPSRELSLFPEKVKVILRGGIDILGRMEEKQIKLYVNYRQALEDTLGSIEPRVEIPDFTTLIDIRPKRLDYIIKQY